MNNYLNFTDREILDVLLLSSNAIAVYSSPEIVIQMANDAMIAFWGKDRSIMGKPLDEAVPELKGQPFIGMLQAVWKTGITDSGKAIPAVTMIKGELQTSYYDYEYRAIKNTAGETYCILHSAEDVTELVLNQQALKIAKEKEVEGKILLQKSYEDQQAINEELSAINEELASANEELIISYEELSAIQEDLKYTVHKLAESEASLRYMVEDAPIAIAVFKGADLIVETANQKVLEAWGKTSDIVGKPLHIAVPEMRDQEFLSILNDVFKTGQPFYGNEVRALVEQNNVVEEVYSNFVYHPLKDAAGQTTHIMLTAHMITEQVKARKKVEHAEEMLRFSVEAANAATWFMDAKTREFRPSERMKELFGFDKVAVVSYPDIISRIPEEYRNRVEHAVNFAFTADAHNILEYPILVPGEHKERWVSAMGKLYLDNDGQASHLSGLLLDITRQKEDEIRKNDFISMVSHELKTPLTSLNAYIQLLERTAGKSGDSGSSVLLQKAGNQLKKMTSMINGFLNISRLESGKIHLQKQTFELSDLLVSMIDEARLSASNFQFKLEQSENIEVFADRDKIGAVISNLLSNAIKYSPNGNLVTVQYQVRDNKAVVSIRDEGLGINEEDLNKLFERFYRVENKDNPHISGFGIGLYLSAEIIHHHNGEIWAESKKGVGSTFYFGLPL